MDAENTPKDAVSQGAGGDSEDKSSKDSSPKIYTEDELEKKFSSQRSVLDAKVAKLEKHGESATKRAEVAEGALAQERKERRESELEADRDDPDKLNATQKRHKEADRKAELDKREREQTEREEKHQEAVKSDLETIRIFNRTKLAAEIAVAKGVSVDSILKLTKEDSREAMEATAGLLPKKGEEKDPLKVDSSKTIGGEGLTDQERLDARYPTMVKK